MERQLLHRAVVHWQARQYRIHNRRRLVVLWTSLLSIYLSVCLSIYIIYLFIYALICLFMDWLLHYLFMHLCLHWFMHHLFMHSFMHHLFIRAFVFFCFFLMHVLKWINWLVDVGWSWLMNVHIEQSWNLDKGEAQISIHWHTILTSCFNLFFNLFAAIYSWSRVVGWRNKFI